MSKSTTSLRSSISSMSKPKIVVTDSAVWVPKLYEIGEVCQSSDEGQMPREKLMEQIKDADALFCLVRDKVDKELLDQAKNLKVVATMSVGYDHVDMAECKKRGISVGYTPGVLTEATAELGIALLLATSRRIPEAVQSAKSGGWSTWTPYYMCGKGLFDSTIGVYGLGNIGKSLAEKLVPFKPRKIIYHNRSPAQEGADNYTYVSFKELLKESDFLIITVSPSPENAGIFNKEAFKQMKNDAILINISRGSLVNLDDLQQALHNKQIGAAGLDVTDPEPLPSNHPLFSTDKCVILPHIGSATFATRNAMASTTEDNIYNFLSFKPMVSQLD